MATLTEYWLGEFDSTGGGENGVEGEVGNSCLGAIVASDISW